MAFGINDFFNQKKGSSLTPETVKKKSNFFSKLGKAVKSSIGIASVIPGTKPTIGLDDFFPSKIEKPGRPAPIRVKKLDPSNPLESFFDQKRTTTAVAEREEPTGVLKFAQDARDVHQASFRTAALQVLKLGATGVRALTDVRSEGDKEKKPSIFDIAAERTIANQFGKDSQEFKDLLERRGERREEREKELEILNKNLDEFILKKPEVRAVNLFSEKIINILNDEQRKAMQSILDEKPGISSGKEFAFFVESGVISLAEAYALKGMTGSTSFAAGFLSLLEGTDVYNEAVDVGKSPGIALQITGKSVAGTFILEKIGLDYLFGQKFLAGGVPRLINGLKVSAFETTQEELQTLWQNYIRREGLDKTQSLWEGWAETAVGIAIPTFVLGLFGGRATVTQTTRQMLINDIKEKGDATDEQAIQIADGLINQIIEERETFGREITEEEREQGFRVVAPGTPTVGLQIQEVEGLPEEDLSEVEQKLNENIRIHQSLGGFTVGAEAESASLRDINEIINTPEGKAIADRRLEESIRSRQIVTNEDGTVTIYRAGAVSEKSVLTSFTTDRVIAERFAEAAKDKDTLIEIIELNVPKEDIQLFIPGEEAEVLIKPNVVVKDVLGKQKQRLIDEGRVEETPTQKEQVKEAVAEEIIRPSFVDDINEANQEVADEDWEENFAEPYGELADEEGKLQAKLRQVTKAADKRLVQKDIDAVHKKLKAIEDEFLTKWAVGETKPEVEPVTEVEVEEEVIAEVTEVPKTVEALETELKDIYRDAPEVQRHLKEIVMEMEEAEPGQKIFIDSPISADDAPLIVHSTHPKWIPEDAEGFSEDGERYVVRQLRTKKLYQKVYNLLKTVDSISYPKGRNVKQRALLDVIFDELDSRTGVNTVELRKQINEQISESKAEATKGVRRSVKRGGRGLSLDSKRVTPEAKKEAEEAVEEIFAKEKPVKEKPEELPPEPPKQPTRGEVDFDAPVEELVGTEKGAQFLRELGYSERDIALFEEQAKFVAKGIAPENVKQFQREVEKELKKVQKKAERAGDKGETKVLRETAKKQVKVRKETVSEAKKQEQKAARRQVSLERREKRRSISAARKELRSRMLEKFQTKLGDIRENKKAIRDYAKQYLSVADRGRANTLIVNAETETDVIKAFYRIDAMAEKADKKRVMVNIVTLSKRILKSPGIAVDYKTRIRSALNQLELKGHSQATINRIQATQNFIESRRQAGDDVEMPRRVMEALKILSRQPLNEMPLATLEAIQSKLVGAEKLGRLKWKTLQSLYQYEKGEVKEEVLEGTTSIEEQEKFKPKIGEDMTQTQRFRNYFINVRNGISELDKYISPMDVIFDILDGSFGTYDGVNMRNFKHRIDADFNTFFDMKDNNTVDVVDRATELSLEEGNYERMGLVAARDQEGGREKLHNLGFTDGEIDAVKLSATEQELLDLMRGSKDKLFPAVQEIMRTVFNQDVQKVENYFSFMTDFDAMSESDVKDRIFGLIEHGGKTKKVDKSFTIKRKGAGKQKIKLNAMEIYLNHMENVAYLLALSKDTQMLFEIANSDEYGEVAGAVGQVMVLEWLDLIARKGGVAGGHQLARLDFIRKNISAGVLGFKLSSAMIQWTAVLDGAGMIGAKWASVGINDFATDSEWRAFVLAFPEIRERAGGELAIRELVGEEWLVEWQRRGFIPLQAVDKIAAASVAVGAYQQKMTELGLEIDLTVEPNQEALQYAQLVVRRTQSSSLFKDLPLTLSAGKGFLQNRTLNRTVLQFQTFLLNRWSRIRHDGIRVGITQKDPKQAVRVISWILVANLAAAGTRMATRRLLDLLTGRDRDDDLEKELLRNYMWELAGTIPFVGNLVSMFLYDSAVAPLIEIPTSMVEGFKRAITGKSARVRAKGWNDFIMGALALRGVPGSIQSQQLIRDTLRK